MSVGKPFFLKTKYSSACGWCEIGQMPSDWVIDAQQGWPLKVQAGLRFCLSQQRSSNSRLPGQVFQILIVASP